MRIFMNRHTSNWDHAFFWVVCLSWAATPTFGQGTRDTTTYRRIKAALDAVPPIDTHDHLWPFDRLPAYVETEQGRGVNLASLWRNSYLSRIHSMTPWKPRGSFDDWWTKAQHDFDDVRATSF